MEVRDRVGMPATPLVIVAGKGGVGRSSVALALAAVYAEQGERVALVHPSDARPTAAGSGSSHRPFALVSLDGQEALNTYLSAQLPGPLAAALRASRAFSLITAATPGLAELLTIGELKRLLEEEYDRVVFDAPATGHLLAMFDAPGRFERAAAVGPIAARARQLGDWIADPLHVSCLTVTTGDGLAVSELLDLITTLRKHSGHEPSLVVANRLAPASPAASELEELERRGTANPAEAAALHAVHKVAARARSERAHLGRVTKATGMAPVRVVERPGDGVTAIHAVLAGEPA